MRRIRLTRSLDSSPVQGFLPPMELSADAVFPTT
jgi:hypothetical protein